MVAMVTIKHKHSSGWSLWVY